MSSVNMFGLVEHENVTSDEVLAQLAKEEEYKRYIDTHIKNVIRAYDELKHNDWINTIYNSDIYEAFDLLDRSEKILNHDASKYSDIEFYPYRVRWHPATEEEKTNAALDEDWEPYKEAWVHHYKNNDHHPEFWIADDGTINDMPLQAIIEMICDWQSFAFIGRGGAVSYWDANKNRKIEKMSPNTVKQVDRIIDILRKEE